MPTEKHQAARLPAFSGEGDEETLNAVIETPKGSRNKFKYDERLGLFRLSGVLPAGANFPFDFGFVPSTLSEDGDPLDVLVLMDEPAFVGCLAPSRLIGVIEAEQIESGNKSRNDRLIAVAAKSHHHRDVKTLKDLSDRLIEEIEHFFISYNAIGDKQFTPLGRFGPDRARKVVEEGEARYREEKGES